MESSDAARQRRKRIVAANVRLARGAMTQEHLGQQLGVPRQRVIEWEGAKHEPGPASIAKLAEVLGKPEWWFYVEHAEDGVAA